MMFDDEYESLWLAMQAIYKLDLTDRQASSFQRFIDDIEFMSKQYQAKGLCTNKVFELIIETTGYLDWMNKKDQESNEDEPDNDNEMNLDSLLFGSKRFNEPEDFLRFVESQEFEKNEEEDAVHVMTIHKSKGKEFPFVFIIGFSQPLMPHYKGDLEEERRIAYVAVTRAKEELYISAIAGLFNKTGARPSYFIEEMGAAEKGWYNRMADETWHNYNEKKMDEGKQSGETIIR